MAVWAFNDARIQALSIVVVILLLMLLPALRNACVRRGLLKIKWYFLTRNARVADGIDFLISMLQSCVKLLKWRLLYGGLLLALCA